MPTRLASSTLVIRPSAWISLKILRSISSRFFDTELPGPIWEVFWAGSRLNHQSARSPATLLAQLDHLAQFYCAHFECQLCCEEKIRRYGLQFLHSLAETLDLGLRLSRGLGVFSGIFPSFPPS